MGLINPVIVKLRVMFQSFWDIILPDDLIVQWHSTLHDFHIVSHIQFDGWYGVTSDVLRVEFHDFCGASIEVYGCCLYLRIFHHEGRISSSLVTAKPRVSRMVLPKFYIPPNRFYHFQWTAARKKRLPY